MSALGLVHTWDVPHVAAAVVAPGATVGSTGDGRHRYRIASVAKLLATYAGLVAVEEGTLALDEPAGRPGATVRHLLAHSAGYGFDGAEPITGVERRRIYSNTGIEVFAGHLADRSGLPFAAYLREAVLGPLGMADTELRGSPAHGIWSTLDDLSVFAAELLRPRLVATATLAEARRVQFPGLPGILPGVGRFDPCDWGLGFERNFAKPGHWAGTGFSPEAFGHFGGSGTFLFVDPTMDRAVICLTDRDFGPWAMDAWPPFCDALAHELVGAGGPAA